MVKQKIWELFSEFKFG